MHFNVILSISLSSYVSQISIFTRNLKISQVKSSKVLLKLTLFELKVLYELLFRSYKSKGPTSVVILAHKFLCAHK